MTWELLVDLALEDHSQYMEADSQERIRETSDTLVPLLRSRLSEAEYKGFARSLFIATLQVARASRGGLLKLQKSISEEEAFALAVLADLYDVEFEFLMSS